MPASKKKNFDELARKPSQHIGSSQDQNFEEDVKRSNEKMGDYLAESVPVSGSIQHRPDKANRVPPVSDSPSEGVFDESSTA